MSLIKYRGKVYVAEKLAAISGQGVSITVPLDKIDVVESLPTQSVIVVANGERYDMLGGTLHIDRKTEKPSVNQRVKLLSRMLLKKAVQEDVAQVKVTAPPMYSEPIQRRAYSQRYSD